MLRPWQKLHNLLRRIFIRSFPHPDHETSYMNEASHPVYVHTSQSKRRAGEVVGPRERTCWIWGYQCQISLIVNRQRQRQRKQKQSSPCTDPHLPPKLISSPMFHLEYLRQPRAMSIPRIRVIVGDLGFLDQIGSLYAFDDSRHSMGSS